MYGNICLARDFIYTALDRKVFVCEMITDNQNGPCPPPPVSLPRPALVNSEPNISRIYTPQLQSRVSLLRLTPMKMELLVSSETSALKAHTPGDYPKDTIRHFCNCL